MRITTVAVALFTMFTVAGVAQAEKSGALLITTEKIDTSSTGWEQDLKKHEVSSLKAENDQWTMFFTAYLKKPAGAAEVQLVFYDEAVKAHDPTNNFPIATQSSAKILVSSIAFGPDQGFKAGHTYKVLVTRLIGGKEEIYARGSVTLK